jgi:hypothetical protein
MPPDIDWKFPPAKPPALVATAKKEIPYYTDYQSAFKYAAGTNKPMVAWYGVKPSQFPDLMEVWADAVHWYRDLEPGRETETGPHIRTRGRDGNYYAVRVNKITANTPNAFREKWGLAEQPPLLRPGVAIEELDE